MSDNHHLIHAHDLTYHYGSGELEQSVLKGVSLEVKSGEFVILAGPSGSGKSTLLSLIGALRGHQRGELRILDRDLNNASNETMRAVRQNIGYVFQQHNLLNFLTASENVQMTLEMFSDLSGAERNKMAADSLTQVGLGDRGASYPSQLSVGQKQRVAIARSLVHQPRLILADEPTASLDSKTGIQVVELLHGMVKNLGCGALVVTHDNRIFDYADRILHIEDGVVYS
ncbi:MAG TPA: ATP-binding cassette domain-containing protein [Alphaproteobacteria bacterium]|nr:ATP-binding cassette domain-containing protein [Alphaproteobacteria bacterium]HOO50590.1 ATP-binding cassette domain-containing protein [Alphaproteobacteria bacterium]